MTDRFEYILFVGFSYFFRVLGLKLSRKFSIILALFFFYIIPIRKNVTIENLTRAFPEYSSHKIKKIAFQCYQSFAITLIEILYLPWMTSEKMEKIIKINNINFVKEKYQQGDGLILMSAHFANWEYMAISCGLQMQIPFSVVVKDQRNVLVNRWMNKYRTKWGNKIVPLGISIRQIYKTLKEKKIVAMVADQRGARDGIRVNFFGRKASVYAGPAMLALKTQTPILYGIAIRQPDYSYTSEFVEIQTKDLTGSDDEKIIELSQRLTDYLEDIIRRNPEQWLWMHKRWKY
jgi:KDO2-lipid IV(A) lauroyltransferase